MARVFESSVGGKNGSCQIGAMTHVGLQTGLRAGRHLAVMLEVSWKTGSRKQNKTEILLSADEALRLIQEIAASLREQGSAEFLAQVEQRKSASGPIE